MFIEEKYFTMSDGIRLYTRIVLPDKNGKFPVVFMRTPYEDARNGEPYPPENYKDNQFIKNGYAVVLQHIRGRGDSEGECRPYEERQDGLDTLEIIRSLPFYNGEIYITGGSYLSTVHLCYLNTNPHDIKAAVLRIQTDRMYFRNYLNGCCYNYCNLPWWLGMLKFRYPEKKIPTEAIRRPYYKIMEQIVGEDVPEYTQLLLNDTYNDFWKSSPQTDAIDRLKIPVLLAEGWYDFYIGGMCSMWERLPEETKKKSTFVIGPWGHSTQVKETAEYPFPNGNIPDDYIVNYFNSIRDNTPYNEFALGKVNYYSIGGDYWTTDGADTQNFKLHFNNDSTLSPKSFATGEQSYIFDPDNVTTCYKHHNIFRAPNPGEAEGVLSFVSEPFTEDMHFYGKVNWNMKVKTDCDDTAFFMRVYMIEDGVAYNLTQTITSLSNINKNYIAGEECTINVSTHPIGFTIKKGNALRVDISSHSNLYVPHSNTKEHWAKVTQAKVATNTVICDEDSYILLPLYTK